MSRALQLVLLACHVAAAIAALRRLPRGFPLEHPHFLTNELLPVLVLGVSSCAGVLLAQRPRTAAQLWSDDQRLSLHAEALESSGVRIDAWTQLGAEVFSHLNSFATILVEGHTRLGLRFSPCPAALIEVKRSEYPSGAPARFAYLDARGAFRVVQASDAEKGPFVTLGEGHLGRGEPLTVSLVELGSGPPELVAQVVLDDWSRELSTALSPTAGFGVAENAIEFGLEAANPSATAYLIFTLAGTSVGRGWDSVGHRAGFYRNRITVRAEP